jgi:TolB-like protein
MRILNRLLICLFLFASRLAAEDLDDGISKLASDLSASLSKASIKKVAVLDFTNLSGDGSDLGRYMAEQLSVQLANSSKEFSVMNRANLNRILEEQKLTASGLMNPENAKKLGLFSGVDAIVMGSITPFGERLNITVQLLSTETAQVVGGTSVKITRSKEINDLLESVSQPVAIAARKEGSDFESPNPKVVYDELALELLSVRFTQSQTIVLTLKLENRDKEGPIKIGLNCDEGHTVIRLVDEQGLELRLVGLTGVSIPGKDAMYNYFQRTNEVLRNRDQQPYVADRINRMYDLDAGQVSVATLTFGTDGRPVGKKLRLNGELILAVIRKNTIQKFKLVNIFIDGIKPK